MNEHYSNMAASEHADDVKHSPKVPVLHLCKLLQLQIWKG